MEISHFPHDTTNIIHYTKIPQRNNFSFSFDKGVSAGESSEGYGDVLQSKLAGGKCIEKGKETKAQCSTVVAVLTNEGTDPCGEAKGIHKENHGYYVGGEFFEFDKGKHVTYFSQQLSLASWRRSKTQILFCSATQSLPTVQRRLGLLFKFSTMRTKWKQKGMSRQ